MHEHVVRVVGRTAERHGRDVDAEVPHEVALGAERQPPHRGVQAVGADDEVEAARCGPLEGDVDAARGPGASAVTCRHRRTRRRRGRPRTACAARSPRGSLDLAVAGRRCGRRHRHAAAAPPGRRRRASRWPGWPPPRSCGMMPISSATGRAGPRTSTGLPLERRPCGRSTTVGAKPVAGQPVGEGGAGDAGAGDQHVRSHARTITASVQNCNECRSALGAVCWLA